MSSRNTFLFVVLSFLLSVSPGRAYQQIELVREVGDPSQKPSQRVLNQPRAIALDRDRIYIADAEAHRIVVLNREGKVLVQWGQKGDLPGQFRSPGGIALDGQGAIYVSDTGNHRIQVFNAEGKYLRGFGEKGSGPKQFRSPFGLVAAAGFLYVADSGNARVQVLTTEGVYLSSITYTAKKEEMKEPVDVAVDAQNRIYALDADSNRVRIFDPRGTLHAVFGASGKGSDGFNGPQGMAVDDRGNIFIADTGNAKIKKFDAQGRLLGAFGSEGVGPGQFKRPAGIKVDRAGQACIVDSAKGTLQVLQIEVGDANPLAAFSQPPSVVMSRTIPGAVAALAIGRGLWTLSEDSVRWSGLGGPKSFGSRGSEPGQFKDPRGIAVDATGSIWVADTGNDRLQKFDAAGKLLQVISRPGSGEGELRSPAAVAFSPKGNVVVADMGNQRVQVFSPRGVFLGTFNNSGKKGGQFREPVAVAVDGADNIYVVDRDGDRITKHDNAGNQVWTAGVRGRMEGEFKRPESIAVSPDGEVYVLDRGNGRVQVFDANGRFLRAFGSEGKGPGEFSEPTSLALEEAVRLYVGDRGNGRVQVFTLRHTPAVPSDLTAQPKMNEVQLSWKSNTEAFFDQYQVYRADAPGGDYKLAAATRDAFFVDHGLPSNRTFSYRVSSAAREGNESAASAAISVTTPKLLPAAPRNLRLDPAEKQITLSWLPNKEPYLSRYKIYRTRQMGSGFEPVAETDRPVSVDAGLPDETLFYYQVTAVGKEGDESAPSEVVFATTPRASLTVPPVDIAKIELREIFASAYKYYESHPLGKVIVRNNTDAPASGVKLTFSIRDFMDFPTEVAVPEIAPKKEVDLLIKPVFNNRILEVTENTPLQSEIALTFYAGGEARTVKRSFPVTLYERHAMTWDRLAKIGAFITPKDPPLAEFARAVVQQYVDAYPNLHSSIVYARAVYAALGVHGLAYIVDPTSPSQEFSEKATAVDYLLYPRDTLSRKSGDCDDLTILFSAAMENVGVSTAIVDVPGHVFVMFNTGVPAAEQATLGFPDALLVVHKGTVWVPVEMTLVGSSFTRAWQKGAEEYRDWAAKGKVEVVEVQKAWEEFRPVTLPPGDGKTVKVRQEDIEAKFRDELRELGRQRLVFLSADYLAVLKEKPNDVTALCQLGILYGENGMYPEALEQFQKLLSVDKGNSVALNNVGNIHLLQERLDDARQAYTAALQADPRDTGIMVNLARVQLRMGRKAEAKRTFQDAANIDPRVLRTFGDLAAELGVTK